MALVILEVTITFNTTPWKLIASQVRAKIGNNEITVVIRHYFTTHFMLHLQRLTALSAAPVWGMAARLQKYRKSAVRIISAYSFFRASDGGCETGDM